MLTTRPSRWARSVGSVARIRRWTPMTFTSNRGGPCTEAACHKTQVIVLDVASDTQWDTYGWRTAALTHGLKSVLAMYWREPRSPTKCDEKIIGQMTHLAAVAIERKRNEAALQQSESRFRLIVDAIPVRALSRNPDKHRELADEVVKADLNRPETLKAAFEGAQVLEEVNSLKRVRDRSQESYLAGVLALTDVLDADRQLSIAQERAGADMRESARAAVGSFRALGGGWTH